MSRGFELEEVRRVRDEVVVLQLSRLLTPAHHQAPRVPDGTSLTPSSVKPGPGWPVDLSGRTL